MCLGCVCEGRLSLQLLRGRLRWLGQPSVESPSVTGLLHLPNMFWISPPPLCICWEVWREVGGDYVWPRFGSVCHLPPRGLRRLLCLHVRRSHNAKPQYVSAARTSSVRPWHIFSCLGFIYPIIYLFCPGGHIVSTCIVIQVVVQLTLFNLRGDYIVRIV